MSKKDYDVLVFIGRFSPLHKGHEAVIEEACKKAEHVVVLIGSAYEPRNIRNPWTIGERLDMFRARFSHGTPVPSPIIIKPLPDYPYDDNKWVASVQSIVQASVPWSAGPTRIGLIGHNKDHTSFYLKMFPRWESVEVENYLGVNATDIRNDLFSHQRFFMSADAMSDGPLQVLKGSCLIGDWWPNLRKEYDLIQEYKKAWEVAPYAPTFVTTDTVVVQSGHILLVKRKAAPGIGQWALPGGFLDQHEKLLDGAIRELKEETKIKVPIPVLKGSIKDYNTFDDPNRSTRGRTITQAYFIDLGFDEKLPKVTGADDAEKAVWVPFKDVKREEMFEDHFHIIDYFTNIG